MAHEARLHFHLSDAAKTEALGRELASAISSKAVIALIGPLGAGKTTFAKGLAKGLSVEEPVSSPTFTMLNEYMSGRIPLYHLDLYRLRETGEFMESSSEASLDWLETELQELLASQGVILIEWANFIDDWIAHQDCISVELNYSTKEISTVSDTGGSEETGREAVISAAGPKSEPIVDTLSNFRIC